MAIQAVAFLLLAIVVMALVTTISATRREHMKKTTTKVVSAPTQPVAGPVEVKRAGPNEAILAQFGLSEVGSHSVSSVKTNK